VLAALAVLFVPCLLALLMRQGGEDTQRRKADSTVALREEERQPLSVRPTSGPSALALEEAASECLRSYQGQEKAVLVSAGYLDLLGRVWGCTVQGDGWVDVCVVRADEGGGSRMQVEHLDAGSWAQELGSGLGGGEDAPAKLGGKRTVNS